MNSLESHGDSRSGKRRSWGPTPIGNVLSDLMARKGYANVHSGEEHVKAWEAVAGELGNQSRARKLSRGVLEVVVLSSTVLQEITFKKTELLKAISDSNPELRVTDIRFRVGRIA